VLISRKNGCIGWQIFDPSSFSIRKIHDTKIHDEGFFLTVFSEEEEEEEEEKELESIFVHGYYKSCI